MLTTLYNQVYYIHCSLCLIYFLAKWSLIYLVISLIGMTACSIWRFLSIKCSRRIHIDGRKGILITGATSGFGLLMAKHFHKLGFTVFACYFNDRETGYKELLELGASQDIKNSSDNSENKRSHLFLIPMDVTSQESVKEAHKMVELVLDKYNMELYCVINNAAITKGGPFEWVDQDSLDQGLATNLEGAFMVSRQFILRIIQSKGRIINISSAISFFPTSGLTVYGSTKIALAHFSDALNTELESYGASCICLFPGNFITASNIIFSRIKCLQDSERKLTDLEREIYRTSIDQYLASMYLLLRIKLLKSNEDPDKIAAIYKIDIPESVRRKRSGKVRKLGLIADYIEKIVQYLGGGASELENSGVIEAFDQAVCLKSPPSHLYPGTFFFTYFAGPALEYFPPILCRLLARLVTDTVLQKKHVTQKH